MKKNTLMLMGILAVAFLLFLNLAALILEPAMVFAQKDADPAARGRYQISSWAAYTGGTTCHYGYYVVDTMSGKIVDKLLEEHKQSD